MSLDIVEREMDQLGMVPSERLIQTAMNIGFSQDELDALRQIYGFAMDGASMSRVPKQELKNTEKERA